ncbi:cytochrome P450 [Actinomadura barringtoniae]|uniref:Cytochrome P450 n=1 Tax=Actinomadura barringtoniae TaxID=1427535 RepID=A0A939PB05_9ACTN|nr:cytochrome P450 [Actinomadura barringtoniae]MBO2449113.1 cytochrome P450 [Actinomadura barringtoniae]
MSADDRDPLPEITLPSGDTMRAASRYADVRQVLADPRFSRRLRRSDPRMARGADVSDDQYSLLNMDPPRHTRLRRIAAAAFTPRRVESWRPRVAAIAAELAADMAAAGPSADLVGAFAFPLPVRVICELLGVPERDREQFRRWSDAALTISTADGAQRLAAAREFRQYVTALLAARRAAPGDALIDALLDAQDEDGAVFSKDELVSLTVTLIAAGHETTANLIGAGVFTLLSENSAGSSPAPMSDGVVEELLRHDNPATYAMPRVATEDVDLPSGRVRAGETVLPLLTAANRDPDAYPAPDRFDPARAGAVPHLSFGHGPHFCLGAGLARLEAGVALTALFTAMPGLELAVAPEDVPWRSGGLIAGPKSLPVRW